MSQHQHPTQHGESPSSNASMLIFILTFIIVGIVVAGTQITPPTRDDDAVQAALQPTEAPTEAPTDVPATDVPPTVTPLPPTRTPTPRPTSTPQPSNTPTDMPTVADSGAADSGAADSGAADSGAQNVNASDDPALVAHGQELFIQCSACHGPDARGIPNLGKDLVNSEFVASQTDEQLVQFITMGRPIWDPLNTTGIDMPPKGGNPALTTEDIQAIVAYLRSISAIGS